jgi:hypothetical protein
MKPLPSGIVSSAFVLPNGEYAWQRSQIFTALRAIADSDQAILGGDVWVVKDGKTYGVFSDEQGMRMWDTLPYKANESWADYCIRTFDESIREIEKTPLENAVGKDAQQYIFYNPAFIEQNDVRLLIPRNKMDVERAEATVAAGYPAVAPILPELLEWLQDMNWLVAKVLAPFLASIGSPLIPHIKLIFETDDEIWKYWIIIQLIDDSPEMAEAFRGELERIAYSPTENEIQEELDETAQQVLKKYGWYKTD